jgi:hypothetical protein
MAMTHAPGTFAWIELAASDAAAAKDFYTAFFGWTASDTPISDDEVYTIYRLDGEDAAASYAMMADQRAAGVPSNWMSYIAVENADATAARAGELGATVMAGPFDVMEHGRMAVLQDPTGAVFALWQAKQHAGLGVRGTTNSLAWNELATSDAARAKEFYTRLFGWEAKQENTGMDYTVFHGPQGRVGGMYQITEQMQGMPPCWLPYFNADDVDAAAEKARSLGATVLMGPADLPGVGRFAFIQDPQGAMFYLIRLLPPAASTS